MRFQTGDLVRAIESTSLFGIGTTTNSNKLMNRDDVALVVGNEVIVTGGREPSYAWLIVMTKIGLYVVYHNALALLRKSDT